MSGFGNRVEDAAALSRADLRASLDRAAAELDRLTALPAGHPDVLRALGAGQRVPVPVSVYEALEATEYEAFERDLADHLEGQPET